MLQQGLRELIAVLGVLRLLLRRSRTHRIRPDHLEQKLRRSQLTLLRFLRQRGSDVQSLLPTVFAIMARIASRSTGFWLLDTTLFFAVFLVLAFFIARSLPNIPP